jgi:hypothetical protein
MNYRETGKLHFGLGVVLSSGAFLRAFVEEGQPALLHIVAASVRADDLAFFVLAQCGYFSEDFLATVAEEHRFWHHSALILRCTPGLPLTAEAIHWAGVVL